MYDTGWWLTYPSEKYESQLVLWFPNIMENKKYSKPPTRYGHMVWYLVWYMVYVWYVIYVYMYIYVWYMIYVMIYDMYDIVRSWWNLPGLSWSIYLLGGWPTPLKNMKVSWDYYSHKLWKNKKNPEPTNSGYKVPNGYKVWYMVYVWYIMYIYIYMIYDICYDIWYVWCVMYVWYLL